MLGVSLVDMKVEREGDRDDIWEMRLGDSLDTGNSYLMK